MPLSAIGDRFLSRELPEGLLASVVDSKKPSARRLKTVVPEIVPAGPSTVSGTSISNFQIAPTK
jgi:hypothetical protein